MQERKGGRSMRVLGAAALGVYRVGVDRIALAARRFEYVGEAEAERLLAVAFVKGAVAEIRDEGGHTVAFDRRRGACSAAAAGRAASERSRSASRAPNGRRPQAKRTAARSAGGCAAFSAVTNATNDGFYPAGCGITTTIIPCAVRGRSN